VRVVRSGISVPQFKNPFLSALRIDPRFDVDGIVCRNFPDFALLDMMRSDKSSVALIPIVFMAAIHVNIPPGLRPLWASGALVLSRF
jgi:hypothetical protein